MGKKGQWEKDDLESCKCKRRRPESVSCDHRCEWVCFLVFPRRAQRLPRTRTPRTIAHARVAVRGARPSGNRVGPGEADMRAAGPGVKEAGRRGERGGAIQVARPCVSQQAVKYGCDADATRIRQSYPDVRLLQR